MFKQALPPGGFVSSPHPPHVQDLGLASTCMTAVTPIRTRTCWSCRWTHGQTHAQVYLNCFPTTGVFEPVQKCDFSIHGQGTPALLGRAGMSPGTCFGRGEALGVGGLLCEGRGSKGDKRRPQSQGSLGKAGGTGFWVGLLPDSWKT